MQLVAPHFFHPLSSLQRNFMYTLIQPQNCRIGNVFGLLRHGKNGCMIVIVPGFGDGIFSSSWQIALDTMLSSKNYSILHLHLSSTYYGSGLHGIDTSAKQLSQIIETVKFDRLVLVGHSTGAQISLEFAKKLGSKITNLTLVLLAPVSDRLAIPPNPLIDTAREWNKMGKGEKILPELLWNCPITARRMLELVERGGEDDYFSPDLDEQYLNAKYKNVVFDRALFVYGTDDEYIGDLNEYKKLVNRIARVTKRNVEISLVVGKVEVIVGDHYFSNSSSNLVEVITQFLSGKINN